MDDTHKLYVGIDLGTTNYCTAVYTNEKIEVLENKEKERIGTSFVCFDDEDDFIVGSGAKRKSLEGLQTNGIYGIKRLIGRRADDEKVFSNICNLSYVVEEQSNRPIIVIKQPNNNIQVTPVAICSMIFSNIKKNIQKKYKKSDEIKAVITVPASFSIAQRQATVDAAEIAGIRVLKLINDPAAIVTRYFFDHRQFQEGDHFAVCDLGGGTFDVAIFKAKSSGFEAIATSGDSCLGGYDFDNLILNHVSGILGKTYDYHPKLERVNMLQLIKRCEEAKIALSFCQYYEIKLSDIFASHNISDIKITRTEFEKMAKYLFERLMTTIKMCVKESNVSKHNIKRVILCGGLSKIPKFLSLLSKYFGGKKLFRFYHSNECLAEGAALQAAMFSETSEPLFAPIRIFDIAQLSIGVRVDAYLMRVIINKNTPIPCHETTIYTTMHGFQKTCYFDIYEGERTDCRKNRYLTTLEVGNITPAPTGRPIELTLVIDRSGLLSAYAREFVDDVLKKLNVSFIEAYMSDVMVKNTPRDAKENKEEDQRFARFATQKRYLLNHCRAEIDKIDISADYVFVKDIYEFYQLTYDKTKDLELCDVHQLIALCKKARAVLKERQK